MEEFNIHTFPNGITLAHKEITTTKLVHCGYTLDIGSRDEREGEEGIAHFWEHMVFKGTSRRKAYHILNRLDAVGGELNAFTTKEKIVFHASILSEYFEKAIDLLTDITFDSIFPEKQIEKERNVILEEMAMYHDSPEDAIQDEFDELIFPNHPLGRNILGTELSVQRFKRDDFRNFVAKNMDTERIVFSVVGNINFGKAKRLAEKYIGEIPYRKGNRIRLAFDEYKVDHKIINKPISQAQCAIGRTIYHFGHKNRIPFVLLSNTLGGNAMNTRLNMSLREKHGLVYAVDAGYTPYFDTGLFSIFFGTDPKFLKKANLLVLKELKFFKENKLGKLQLHQAKEQLLGQMAMSEENNMSLMLMMGRSLLNKGRIDSIEYLKSEIRKITAEELQDIANEVFLEDQLSQLTYLPEKR